ncbi:MAG: hypothetical protein WC422_05350, partial [Candidatus Paceibacterota bacterium]
SISIIYSLFLFINQVHGYGIFYVLMIKNTDFTDFYYGFIISQNLMKIKGYAFIDSDLSLITLPL